MSSAIVPVGASAVAEQRVSFTEEQIELLKRTIAKGTSDDELRLFVAVAQPIEESGLDRAQEVLDRHLRIRVLPVPKADSIGQIGVPEEQRERGRVVR